MIPSRAEVQVDCRVPPGLGEEAARRRIAEVLGERRDGSSIEFTEQVVGNRSPVDEPADGRDRRAGSQSNDPERRRVPVILPGFTDSRWFRDAFPDCVAYGFFPQRHRRCSRPAPLVHSADERIDVRDLGFATALLRRHRPRAAGLSRPERRLDSRHGDRRSQPRLDPAIFRLPVERIREGYYSDAYFVYTKALLEAEGHHPTSRCRSSRSRSRCSAGSTRRSPCSSCARAGRPDGELGARLGRSSTSTRCDEGDRDRAAGDGDDDRGRLHACSPISRPSTSARWPAAR